MSDARMDNLKRSVLGGDGWSRGADGVYSKSNLKRPSAAADTSADPRPGRLVRQAVEPKLNKLEAEWLATVKHATNAMDVRHHALTFLLANGVRYTPDVTYWLGDRLCADEVKGKQKWDDAIVKMKTAPSVWPRVRWRVVWKDEGGRWRVQELLPA